MANKDWLSKGADGLQFCERLGDLIANNKTTATAVSTETGISQSALSEYISGKNKNGNVVYRAPDCASLIALSKYFSVSTDYLLGLTDIKTSDADVQAIAKKTGLSESNITLLHDFAKPSDDQCDSSHEESISDYVIYEYDPKYAPALVNDFIEFAFASGTIPDIPFEHYHSFRQQIERSNKYAQEWNELTDIEKYQHARAACDANNSALEGGLFPFAPEDAAILFLKIFCDSFYNYLNSKYPASKHPLNFGWISRSE